MNLKNIKRVFTSTYCMKHRLYYQIDKAQYLFVFCSQEKQNVSKLVCSYYTKHPLLRISPAKIEQVFEKPPIYIFREFASEADMEDLKHISGPKVRCKILHNISFFQQLTAPAERLMIIHGMMPVLQYNIGQEWAISSLYSLPSHSKIISI